MVKYQLRHKVTKEIINFEIRGNGVLWMVDRIKSKYPDYEEIDAPPHKENKGKKPWLRFLYK